jgi:hypothetical protein
VYVSLLAFVNIIVARHKNNGNSVATVISSKADVDHSASRVNSLPAKQETFRRFLHIHAFLTLSFKVFTDVVFPFAVGIPSESDYFKRSFSSPYLVTLFPSEGCDYAVDTEIVMHKRTGLHVSLRLPGWFIVS